MKSRVFLIALVLLLLLVNAAFAQAMNATVVSGGSLLGLIPFWELKHSLPCGIFAAAALAAALGMGAQFWAGLLPACGAGKWVPAKHLSQFATTGLWCGWPLLGACFAVAASLFPWASPGAQGEAWFQSRNALMVQLGASVVLLAVLRAVQGMRGGKAGLPQVFVSAAVALSCGLMWWNGRALDFLAMALIAPPALSLLLAPPAKKKARNSLAWLLVAALALGTYACGSQYLMVAYLPEPVSGWGLLSACCAGLALLLTLALALFPRLRCHALSLRVAAALALLLLVGYNWEMLAPHVLTQKHLLTYPAAWVGACVYALFLVAIAGLARLRLWR